MRGCNIPAQLLSGLKWVSESYYIPPDQRSCLLSPGASQFEYHEVGSRKRRRIEVSKVVVTPTGTDALWSLDSASPSENSFAFGVSTPVGARKPGRFKHKPIDSASSGSRFNDTTLALSPVVSDKLIEYAEDEREGKLDSEGVSVNKVVGAEVEKTSEEVSLYSCPDGCN